MLGINLVNQKDRELFRDEWQRPWIIRLKVVFVLSRLHPKSCRSLIRAAIKAAKTDDWGLKPDTSS
jgi:hypothetical protein